MGVILASLPGWFKCDDIFKAIGTVPVGKMNAEILCHLLLQQPYGWGRGGTQTRKLRLRDVKRPSQGHTGWDLKPVGDLSLLHTPH